MQNIQRLTKSIGLIILCYSILVFLGGAIGFIIKRSLPSLVMGSLFGLSLVFASVQIFACRLWGLYVAAGLVLVLEAFFAYRFVISWQLFPAGIMLIITTTTLILFISKNKKIINETS